MTFAYINDDKGDVYYLNIEDISVVLRGTDTTLVYHKSGKYTEIATDIHNVIEAIDKAQGIKTIHL